MNAQPENERDSIRQLRRMKAERATSASRALRIVIINNTESFRTQLSQSQESDLQVGQEPLKRIRFQEHSHSVRKACLSKIDAGLPSGIVFTAD